MTKKTLLALFAFAIMNTSNAMTQEMTWSPTATRFSLWSPSADSVKVNIYAEGLGGNPLQTIMLRKETTAEKWEIGRAHV